MFFGFANFNTDEIKRLLPEKSEQFLKELLEKSGLCEIFENRPFFDARCGVWYGKCNLTLQEKTGDMTTWLSLGPYLAHA